MHDNFPIIIRLFLTGDFYRSLRHTHTQTRIHMSANILPPLLIQIIYWCVGERLMNFSCIVMHVCITVLQIMLMPFCQYSLICRNLFINYCLLPMSVPSLKLCTAHLLSKRQFLLYYLPLLPRQHFFPPCPCPIHSQLFASNALHLQHTHTHKSRRTANTFIVWKSSQVRDRLWKDAIDSIQSAL